MFWKYVTNLLENTQAKSQKAVNHFRKMSILDVWQDSE